MEDRVATYVSESTKYTKKNGSELMSRKNVGHCFTPFSVLLFTDSISTFTLKFYLSSDF